MTHTETSPAPASAHTAAATRDKFGHAAVTRIGDGFTVTASGGGFVTMAATDGDTSVSIAVYHTGIPTLIAALQQAATEAQS